MGGGNIKIFQSHVQYQVIYPLVYSLDNILGRKIEKKHTCISFLTSHRPGGGEMIMPPADGSSTRGGSTSARGRVRSPQISGGGGGKLAGSQRAYSLRQLRPGTDRRKDRLMPPMAGALQLTTHCSV